MGDAPQYRPQSAPPPSVQISSTPGGDSAWGAVAANLNRLGDRLDARLDEIASDEGAKAGGLAGLDPQFRPSGSPTLRAQAYDRAGLRVALARLESNAQDKADAIFEANKEDPAKLGAEFDKALGESLGQLNGGLEVLKPDLQLSFERLRRGYMGQAATIAEKRMAEADQAAIIPQLEARKKRIQSLAYAATSDAQAAEAMQSELAGLQALLVEHGPKAAFSFAGTDYPADPHRGGSFGVDDMAKIMVQATESAGQGRVLGKWDQAKTLAEMEQLRAGFSEDYKKGKLPLSLDQFERMASGMDSDINAKKAEARAAGTALKSIVDDQVKLLEQGFRPNVDLDSLSLQARSVGRPDIAEAITAARGLYAFQDAARKLPPPQLEQWISTERARLEKGGANLHEVARLKLAESLLGSMQAGLKSDPLKWAAERGGRPLSSIEMQQNPGGLVAPSVDSLKRRFSDAEAIAKDYGVAPKYFTEAERATFTAALDTAPAAQKLAILGQLASAAGDERLPRLMSEIGATHPALAHAGLLMAQGNASAAAHIAAGVELLKLKDRPDLTPKPTDRADAQRLLTAVPGDVQGTLNEAALAIYAARASAGPVQYPRALFLQSLLEAAGQHQRADGKIVGGFGSVHGASVMLPDQMSEDEADHLLDSVSDVELVAFGAHGASPVGGSALPGSQGKPIPAEAIRDAYPVNVGPGLYAFSMTNPKNEMRFYGAGTPDGMYVLDLTRMAKQREMNARVFKK